MTRSRRRARGGGAVQVVTVVCRPVVGAPFEQPGVAPIAPATGGHAGLIDGAVSGLGSAQQ